MTSRMFTAVLVASASMLGTGWAAGPERKGGECVYDTQTVETITGKVKTVDRVSMGKREGVHLMLTTGKETIAVHLGPAWFIDNQELTLAAGDSLEIRGSRVTFQDEPAFLAATVTRGEDVLELRDADGTPRWSGWRRRNAPGRPRM